MNFSNEPTEYLKQKIQDSIDYPGVWEIAVTATTRRLMEIELIERLEFHNEPEEPHTISQCFCDDCQWLVQLKGE
jgi:hypothetical protein